MEKGRYFDVKAMFRFRHSWWLDDIIHVLSATILLTLKWLILCHVNFTLINYLLKFRIQPLLLLPLLPPWITTWITTSLLMALPFLSCLFSLFSTQQQERSCLESKIMFLLCWKPSNNSLPFSCQSQSPWNGLKTSYKVRHQCSELNFILFLSLPWSTRLIAARDALQHSWGTHTLLPQGPCICSLLCF